MIDVDLGVRERRKFFAEFSPRKMGRKIAEAGRGAWRGSSVGSLFACVHGEGSKIKSRNAYLHSLPLLLLG